VQSDTRKVAQSMKILYLGTKGVKQLFPWEWPENQGITFGRDVEINTAGISCTSKFLDSSN